MKKLADVIQIQDFRDRIGGVFDGFELKSLEPYFRQILDGPFGRVLPESHLFWKSTTYTDTDKFALVRANLIPYVVYSVYAKFIMQGSFIATETGLQKHESQFGEHLTPEERAALSRTWNDTALPFLNEIVGILEPSNTCKDTGRIANVRVTTIVGENTSKFS